MPSPAQYYFTFRDVQPNHEGVMPEGGRQVFSSMDVSQADLHEGVRVKAQGYGTGMITEILDIDGGASRAHVLITAIVFISSKAAVPLATSRPLLLLRESCEHYQTSAPGASPRRTRASIDHRHI